MKKISVTGLVIALVLSSISFASVNPKVQLDGYTLSENPAVPGDVVTLTLHLKSIEPDNCAERVSAQLTASYPLSMPGMDTQYIQDPLCPSDNESKGTISFPIQVDQYAQTGTYQASLLTTYQKDFLKFTESNVINVRVQGQPSLSASVISSNPVDIYPGDSASVTIKYSNTGTGSAKSVHSTLSSSSLDVKWADSSVDLGQISSLQSTESTVTVEAPKNLKPGTYSLNAQLDYFTEDNIKQTASFSFNVPVKNKAEFEAVQSSNSQVVIGSDSNVGILLKNSGSEEARKVKVIIRPVYPFSTDGTVRYIESLKPGNQEPLDYMISVDKQGTPGQQIISLQVDYEDPQGKKFSDSIDLALNARNQTILEIILSYWYLVIIAIIVVVMLARGRMKKN